MGTLHDKGDTVWIRCFDGTEMEYEPFSKKEMKYMISKMSNQNIANKLLAVLDNSLEEYLERLRKEI